jgi:hypothetical protein
MVFSGDCDLSMQLNNSPYGKSPVLMMLVTSTSLLLMLIAIYVWESIILLNGVW